MIANQEKTAVEKREVENVDTIERTRSGKVFVPRVDIRETDEEVIVFADMPGTSEKDIDITLEQNVLTIHARVMPVTMDGLELQYREYETGDYQRSFNLTDTIDRDKIDAAYTNGVLSLRLPKVEPAKPKKIKVKVG